MNNLALVHKKNHFKNDLQLGNSENFWKEFYKLAFPDMVCSALCEGKNEKGKVTQGQKLGIDVVIELESGKTIKIDKKIRRKNYNDFALEFRHYKLESNSKVAGWIQQQLQIDYIAYAFEPSKTVYLLDWILLKKVWNNNKTEWFSYFDMDSIKWNQAGSIEGKNNFFIIGAFNENNDGYNNYISWSLAVPIQVLLDKLQDAAIIQMK